MCIRDRPYRGTIQLFELLIPTDIQKGNETKFRQITNTDHDYNYLIGLSNQHIICHRVDINHAVEIYSVDIATGVAKQITQVNTCLLYTSDAADERSSVDLGGRRIIKKKKKNNNVTV